MTGQISSIFFAELPRFIPIASPFKKMDNDYDTRGSWFGTAVFPGPSYHVVKDAAVAFTAVCLETQGSIWAMKEGPMVV